MGQISGQQQQQEDLFFFFIGKLSGGRRGDNGRTDERQEERERGEREDLSGPEKKRGRKVLASSFSLTTAAIHKEVERESSEVNFLSSVIVA